MGVMLEDGVPVAVPTVDVSTVNSQTIVSDPQADASLRVRFFKHAVFNQAKSEEAGRQIFDEVDYISIVAPGQRNSEHVCKVRDIDKARFPQQWSDYQANQEQRMSGTPLDMWPAVGVAKVAEMNALNVFTVEQLAAIPDTAIGKLGPGTLDLRNKAKAYIDGASENAETKRMGTEIEQLKAELRRMNEEFSKAGVEHKKRPGRRAKVVEEALSE